MSETQTVGNSGIIFLFFFFIIEITQANLDFNCFCRNISKQLNTFVSVCIRQKSRFAAACITESTDIFGMFLFDGVRLDL